MKHENTITLFDETVKILVKNAVLLAETQPGESFEIAHNTSVRYTSCTGEYMLEGFAGNLYSTKKENLCTLNAREKMINFIVEYLRKYVN
jgi:hypothetical protein